MHALADGGRSSLTSHFDPISSAEVTMDLTMCGLLVERAEEIARLYAEHGNWNDVKDVWFSERRSNRSTRGSSQKIYRVLTSRFKNAPPSLPNPSTLPKLFESCSTQREKAQILYLYLVTDDPLVRYVVHGYVDRLLGDQVDPLDFSNDTLVELLNTLEYRDGSSFDYAESTTRRWCEGFRSVMREIGVLESQKTTDGTTPTVDDQSLLVALGYSYEEGGDNWVNEPLGLLYLLQPEPRWEELFDRVAKTNAWEFIELQSTLKLRPTAETYGWIETEGDV